MNTQLIPLEQSNSHEGLTRTFKKVRWSIKSKKKQKMVSLFFFF